MPLRLRALLTACLLLATIGASGCGKSAANASATAAPPTAAPEAAAATAAPQDARPESTLLGAGEMGAVYQMVLERYVDRIDHEQLISAATKAFRDALVKDGALPLD